MHPSISTGHFVEASNGVKLHYASCGDAKNPPVILVHGFPEYWGAWQDVMPELAAKGWYAIAPDIRGFNLSDKPEGLKAYSNKEVCKDLAGLLQKFTRGSVKPLLVAHDWGGAAAWSLGMTAPELMRALVIVNSPHPYLFWRELSKNKEQQAASAYMNWLCRPDSEKLLAGNNFERMRGFFTKMSPAPWFKGEVLQGYLDAWAQPGSLTGGVNYYRASPLRPPSEADPAAAGIQLDPAQFLVRANTLVVWGMSDVALPPPLIDGIRDVVPKLELVQLPQCTHWVSHEVPQTLSRLIDEFGRKPSC